MTGEWIANSAAHQLYKPPNVAAFLRFKLSRKSNPTILRLIDDLERLMRHLAELKGES